MIAAWGEARVCSFSSSSPSSSCPGGGTDVGGAGCGSNGVVVVGALLTMCLMSVEASAGVTCSIIWKAGRRRTVVGWAPFSWW